VAARPHDCGVLTPWDDTRAAAECLARTRCWLERAVIGLNLCPFARAVHAKGQIRFAVTGARTAGELVAELQHEIELLAASDPALLDTTLLIHPLAMTEFIDHHLFLGEANAAVRRGGWEGTLQIASFHPQFEFAGAGAEDIGNYTNRSPHPTLHLLREASVDRAVAAFPDAAAIYGRNIETLRQLGHEGWRALWRDEPEPGA